MARSPEEIKKRRQEYYQRTKQQHLARAKASKLKCKVKWNEFKSNLSCSRCGESHPAILDFHHVVKENKQIVWDLIRNNAFNAAVKEVTEKCIVLCSNCHRKLHWNERRDNDQ